MQQKNLRKIVSKLLPWILDIAFLFLNKMSSNGDLLYISAVGNSSQRPGILRENPSRKISANAAAGLVNRRPRPKRAPAPARRRCAWASPIPRAAACWTIWRGACISSRSRPPPCRSTARPRRRRQRGRCSRSRARPSSGSSYGLS